MKLNILVLIVLVLVFSKVYTQTNTPMCAEITYHEDRSVTALGCATYWKVGYHEVPGNPNLPYPGCCPTLEPDV
ncbi:hypothetical protein DLAC_02334 [Tieghemostelium lacteum]|uniref:Single domain-containing protein n=1 Tax=Tieghemostelium lacteum TaxID=361077 RepID=A0A152A4Q1_TIELA|nr:hypothetical protein DLAC_02334 [Tieghemostelium lacteum]|eukprot:KYR01216.1 hypothetical protein DLAC_02334 [Tieghemostelium lacteum]